MRILISVEAKLSIIYLLINLNRITQEISMIQKFLK